MKPEGWRPHVQHLIKRTGSWHGNKTSIVVELSTGGYAICFFAGYIHKETLEEIIQWFNENNYHTINEQLKSDPTALQESNEAFQNEYWERIRDGPKGPAAIRVKPDALSVLKSLGLV